MENSKSGDREVVFGTRSHRKSIPERTWPQQKNARRIMPLSQGGQPVPGLLVVVLRTADASSRAREVANWPPLRGPVRQRHDQCAGLRHRGIGHRRRKGFDGGHRESRVAVAESAAVSPYAPRTPNMRTTSVECTRTRIRPGRIRHAVPRRSPRSNSRSSVCCSYIGIGSVGSACTAPIAAYGITATVSITGVAIFPHRRQASFGLGKVAECGVAYRDREAAGQRLGKCGQLRKLLQRDRSRGRDSGQISTPVGPLTEHHRGIGTVELDCTAVELGNRQQFDLDGRDDAHTSTSRRAAPQNSSSILLGVARSNSLRR